ncbi:MAG TPA: hypothetical protein VFH27_04950, partial [Longimicrobiaceae bacterium]|nr:hypothetical protein [Longimicrobiaceae bacterium]
EPAPAGLGGREIAAGTDARGDVHVLYAPAGRGMGHLVLRGGHALPAEYLDRDGTMMAIAPPVRGLPLEAAYIGGVVSRERPRAEGDVYVRALGARGPAPAREAYVGPGRYSHRPRLTVDGQGVRHLFWLEDTDGTVRPEALYASTSPDGVRWTPARDLTPPSLRAGVVSRVWAVADATGRVHLALRRCDADGARPALYYLSIRGGVVSPVQPLAAPGELGPGDTQLVLDSARRRVVALWRGVDGVYRWRTLPVG